MKVGKTRYSPGGSIRFGKYRSGEIAIQIINDNNEPELVATVSCVPHGAPILGKNEVYIKDWSENEGIADALVKAGVITLTGESVHMGYSEALVGKLTKEAVILMTAQQID